LAEILWKNLLIEGDNLGAAEALRQRFQGEVDLIYLDPPFATEADFTLRAAPGQKGPVAYSDRWADRDSYLAFLRARLTLCHELLGRRGALYLHLDHRRVHHARLLLDEIFGEDRLVNEIIWHYRSGGRARGSFAFKHDTLLVYGKSRSTYFNGAAVALPRGPGGNHMKRGADADGRAYRSIKSNGKEYRYYEDDGVPPDDVWSDISHLHQRDPERTGYPTQKPEKLLERVILASSPPGGLVADLFCGSGTTLAVAQRLGRRWVGCDVGAAAVATARGRLTALGAEFDELTLRPP